MTSISVRDEGLDKFYTIPSISKKCLEKIESYYNWVEWDLVIEPSAGNGSFLSQIPTDKKIGIDISPEHPDIIKQDFLTYTPSNVSGKILVVGNPPFGRVSSLAIKFFNHASKWGDVIAFIIPRTFRRVSVHNKLNRNFHLVFDDEIPMKPCSFNPPMMAKCCFQIWEKREHPRGITEKLDPIGYNFVKKTENPDISFRRVGINAGTITDIIDDQNVNCFYFIKFTNGLTVKENMDKIKNIQFVHNNTVGPRSISKQELIIEFTKVI